MSGWSVYLLSLPPGYTESDFRRSSLSSAERDGYNKTISNPLHGVIFLIRLLNDTAEEQFSTY
jgi:hypothetical protein